MINKTIALSFMLVFIAFSLVACGISADVHDAAVAEKEAAQASVAQLEKEKETAQAQLEKEKETAQAQLEKEKETAQAQLEKEKETAQASVSQLELENESVKTDLAKAQETVQNLNAVYPPKRFNDRTDIEAWLRNDDISERETPSLAEGQYSNALEQQARGLEDGYIVSAEYSGPDENHEFFIWLSAVTEDLDYFMWFPESDEVFFITSINLLE